MKLMHYYQSLRKLPKFVLLFLLCLLECVLSKVFFSNKCESWLFKHIRLLVFYLDGFCKNTGLCCKNLQLTFESKVLVDQNDFLAAQQKYDFYKSFIPKAKNGEIETFNCRWLSDKNLCEQYSFRPQFCQNYPASLLISNGRLKKGCGYTFKKRFNLPFFASKALRNHVFLFELNNII